jgi:predicted alpha/beta superfamily hydrolase
MKPCLLFLALLLFPFTLKAQGTASPNVETFMLYWPEQDTSRKIWLYLPKNYDKKRKDRYPVIYMPDGQNLFDKATSAFGEWEIDETLDSLEVDVIVVGIEHGGDERINELTPYASEKHGGGRADVYLDYVMYTLKPYVDARYRTKKDPANTMIFGSSLGGLVSYYALLNYPHTFGKAGVFSPAFWFTEDIYELSDYVDAIEGKVYFMAGSNESETMVPNLDRMYSIVENKVPDKNNIRKKIVPDGRHNEALWSKEFAEAVVWLLK